MQSRCAIPTHNLAWLSRLVLLPALGVTLLAQPQIGGGPCTSATLSGNYSFTLSGRDVASAATLSAVSVGVGSATFDGLSKVTFTLTGNTAKSQGVAETLSGVYSLAVNCTGTIAINSGGTASFTLVAYNQGKSYLIAGEDGTYAYSGSGSTLPATCSASQLNGTYSFNGSGFSVTSGDISGVTDFSGLMQFDGTQAATANWYISSGGGTKVVAASGSYNVSSNCSGTASMTDASGNTYTLQLTVTSTTGGFVLGGSSPQMVFTASGRTL
jgi:hypothetical protein